MPDCTSPLVASGHFYDAYADLVMSIKAFKRLNMKNETGWSMPNIGTGIPLKDSTRH